MDLDCNEGSKPSTDAFENAGTVTAMFKQRYHITLAAVTLATLIATVACSWQVMRLSGWQQDALSLVEMQKHIGRELSMVDTSTGNSSSSQSAGATSLLIAQQDIVRLSGEIDERLQTIGAEMTVRSLVAATREDRLSDIPESELNLAVLALGEMASARSARVQFHLGVMPYVIYASAFLVLFAVFGVGIIIFRPMQRTVIDTYKRLSSSIEDLKEANKRIEDASEQAFAADRSKSEFLANMSHEIRTPMNGVMGMAELLSKTQLDSKQRMFTDVIVKSGSALLTIINDILDFSKIDAGRMHLDPAPFRIAEAVEDVATLISPRVADKDLELAVRIDPELPDFMIGDVGRLRQIITNLAGNAVKFTETGHVYIEVTGKLLANQSRSDDLNKRWQLHVRIEDTGIGIPEEKRAKVFEKFSQVDESATRKHEGTGLGLAISRALVELMGGEIGVESEVGKGSVFWFTVELPQHDVAVVKKTAPLDVCGARILIIDDNAVNREILLEQMESWKFESAAVSSGREAIQFLTLANQQQLKVDAIILDYQMPEMNGEDVVTALRQDARTKDIPVIMLTSVAETAQGKSFLSLDIQAHLNKPARSSILLETIVDVLQGSHQSVDPAEGVATPVQPIEASATNTPDRVDPQFEILVCEDNEVNQIVFSQILNETAHTYEIADNGSKGLALFKSTQPKLILMDVSMPEMNGLEATKAIREYETTAGLDRVPIIGVTAHAIKGDREKCIAAGMDDYLTKPISSSALKEKITKWMQSALAVKSA